MAAWPSNLRAPVVGYGVKPVAAFIRTDMEAGAPRQRKRFTAVPHNLSLSWRFTAAQMADFRTFFNTTINRGTDWFTMTLDAGSGLTSYDVRFVAPYESTLLSGVNWAVSGQVEVNNA